MRMRKISFPGFLALLLVSLVFLPSCSQKGDPVRNTLDQIVAAAEKTDDAAVMELISASFQGPGGESKTDLASEVRRYFFAYESLSVTLSDVTIEKGPDRARAVFVAALSGTVKKISGLDGILPRSSRWKFEVSLALEDKTWRITTGKWQRLD
jgi:hypothetical protein